MPTLEWNKIWAKNYKTFSRGRLGNQAEHYGDQWGLPENKPHLRRIVEKYLVPFVNPKLTALEIGSGGGRWTNYMADFGKVYCVDLNPEMLDYMRQRFIDEKSFEYVLTTGTDFPGVPQHSVDFAFTYGVFVHLDLELIEGYLNSLKSVLRPDAHFVVQFSDMRKEAARKNPGFSDNDPARMAALLEKYEFRIDEQDEFKHSAIFLTTFRSQSGQNSQQPASA